MDSYSKTNIVAPVPNQGSSFAQGGRGRGRGDARRRGCGRARGGRTGKSTDRSDKDWAKDKVCGRCGETGHVATACPNDLPTKGKKKTSDDERSRSSKSSQGSAKSNQKQINKIKSKLKTSFAQIKEARNQIEELEEEDLTDSDDEDGDQFLMFGEHIFPDLDFEASVEWCPTELMHGDFMTKPTQGTLFTETRDQIMGVSLPEMPNECKPTKREKARLAKSKKVGQRWLRAPCPQECVG